MSSSPDTLWSTADDRIASVSEGQVKGIAAGIVKIMANYQGDSDPAALSASAILTVTDPVISTLAPDPETASVPSGKTQLISVMATLSDSSTVDLTEDKTVTWKSSDDTIATVDNGTVTAVIQGEVTITATAEGVPSTMTVTVVDPVVTGYHARKR